MATESPPSISPSSNSHAESGHSKPGLLGLAVGALGVVYGDIGTSPLYTFAELMGQPLPPGAPAGGHGALPRTPDNVLGVLSLVFWALMFVVTIKYVTFIMRAHNRGEGGILALLALVPDRLRGKGASVGWITLLVIAGAALLYGDGVITPAISVLGAIEGLKQLQLGSSQELLDKSVVPITLVILAILFAIQKRGTGSIGRLFGPIMILWFVTIAVLGAIQIAQYPSIARAFSPHYAFTFMTHHGARGFTILGSVVLAVTGGEALYADMGHFGARPIRISWLVLVFPALVLCYFGQGAQTLRVGDMAENPFFALAPSALKIPMVILATFAAVIASQALISGAFSLTHQGIQLGLFPRVPVLHTSKDQEGQIYVPHINWGLAIMTILLVLQFPSSSKLAAAYGIAVSGTMAITSIVFYEVSRETWKWPAWKAFPLLAAFLSVDLAFFSANLLKFVDGGYVPILIGAACFAVMHVWKVGRGLLAKYFISLSQPMPQFLESLDALLVARIPGTAIFLTSSAGGAPPLLVRHVKCFRVLQQQVLLVTVFIEHDPFVEEKNRVTTEEIGKGLTRVVLHFGFMDRPDVPLALKYAAKIHAIRLDMNDATYFLGRETIMATDEGEMRGFPERLFAFLSRNAMTASNHFGIPTERVVEVGVQIDL